ncbi:hypothetical protein [Paracoccus suum]|uniref:hypothetical protein n=1 Tax=Paracoccus suum TaxID=2259340 RepID=UPI0013B06915|nr:hypothetical protein [Paracoccus suum]
MGIWRVATALDTLPVTVRDANKLRGWIVEVAPSDLPSLASNPIVESIYAAPGEGALR